MSRGASAKSKANFPKINITCVSVNGTNKSDEDNYSEKREKISQIEEHISNEIKSMHSRNTSIINSANNTKTNKYHYYDSKEILSINSSELDNEKSFKTIEVIDDDESVEGLIFGESMFNNQIFAMDALQLSLNSNKK